MLVGDEGDEVADPDSPADHQPAAEPEDHQDACARDELHHRNDDSPNPREREALLLKLGIHPLEARDFGVLERVRLDHRHAREILLCARRE